MLLPLPPVRRADLRHGHVAVNGRKVNIPFLPGRGGDEIRIREGRKKITLTRNLNRIHGEPSQPPRWLHDHANLSAKVLRCAA